MFQSSIYSGIQSSPDPERHAKRIRRRECRWLNGAAGKFGIPSEPREALRATGRRITIQLRSELELTGGPTTIGYETIPGTNRHFVKPFRKLVTRWKIN
jgi:hypothetical protein